MPSDLERGYVLGQTAAYLEQITAGAKLAAQVGCSHECLEEVLGAAAAEGCSVFVEDRTEGHVAVWMFKHEFARQLIDAFPKDTPPDALRVWSIGKLFGYSDIEIGSYLKEHGLIK